jgi:hypothetical protein
MWQGLGKASPLYHHQYYTLMKRIIAGLLFSFAAFPLYAQLPKQVIVTDDIDHFWTAYDKITATKDTALQYAYINQLYIEKASPGLKDVMALKGYTARGYVAAINQYPLFWRSIRENTLTAKLTQQELVAAAAQLKQLYPDLQPADIFFTIGLFRTNGTIQGRHILLGAEMAMANRQTVTTEFPANMAGLRQYFDQDPIKTLPLLVAHEYVHTQQKPMIDNLLTYCLYEGVAEFVSCKATGQPSSSPAINFGKTNEASVKRQFEKEMFVIDNVSNWMWSSRENIFKTRDLGYYIGYAIGERYYEAATDKQKAIKEMIELDYANEAQVERLVNKTKFFSASLKKLFQRFEKSRPKVIGIKEFKNGSRNVNPGLTQITLFFSAPMDKTTRGFDYGPLGESNVLRVQEVIGFSEDGRSFSFKVALQPNQRYQSMATNRFRSASGNQLKPFIIDITTGK